MGGIYQTAYLKKMQCKLIESFEESRSYQNIARMLAKIPTQCYLDNLIGISASLNPECLLPAGPVELMTGQGITQGSCEKILRLTVMESHVAALFEAVKDLKRSYQPNQDQRFELIQDCSRLLKDKLAVLKFN